MIKNVTQKPATRKFIATTMLATTVVATNANNLNIENKNNTSSQIEVISKTGAEALKNNAYTLELTKTKRNKNLDKLYIKNCEPKKTIKDKKSTLDALYNVYGTYGATIEIQKEIDNAYLDKAFDLYLNHYTLSGETKEKALTKIDEFYEWQNDVYYTSLYQEELKMYDEQSFPDAEKAISLIDNHIKNSQFFSKKDVEIYNKSSKIFESNQNEYITENSKSDLLAYKIHLLNSLAFNNYIKENNFPESGILGYYFSSEFVNGDALIKP